MTPFKSFRQTPPCQRRSQQRWLDHIGRRAKPTGSTYTTLVRPCAARLWRPCARMTENPRGCCQIALIACWNEELSIARCLSGPRNFDCREIKGRTPIPRTLCKQRPRICSSLPGQCCYTHLNSRNGSSGHVNVGCREDELSRHLVPRRRSGSPIGSGPLRPGRRPGEIQETAAPDDVTLVATCRQHRRRKGNRAFLEQSPAIRPRCRNTSRVAGPRVTETVGSVGGRGA